MVENTGIYEIRNTVNGKRYVGSAVKFSERWKKHQTLLDRGTHHCAPLQRSWAKHGQHAFEFKKLVFCSRENLIFYEQAVMEVFQPEYNVARKAGSCLGVKRSAESIAKRTESRKGFSLSQDARSRISASLKGRPGRKPSEELFLERMRIAQRARDTSCLKDVWARKVGVPRTSLVKEKLSKANARFLKFKYAK